MDDELSGEIAAATEPVAPVEGTPAPHTPGSDQTAEPPIAASEPAALPAPRARGPIPLDAHERILATTRTRYEKQLEKLDFARRLDPERVRYALALAEAYDADPDGFVDQASQRLHRRGAAPAPDRQDEQGNLYYSPEQAAAWARFEAERAATAAERRLESRLAPLEASSREAQSWQRADAQIAQYIDEPWFAEHEAGITEAIANARIDGVRLSLSEAIVQVVIPALIQPRQTLEADIRRKTLADLNETSTAAADTVNPHRGPAPTVRPDWDRPMGELLEEEMRRRKLA